ncbi:hypothetical protein AK812_SmicGene10846 [Symbiodinium microadriaticum]|uniref:Uncharacterized protein n=1 Tax=Symbiodinium microadriaticum TaxID=2951 RepID=A0A1Q9EES0_SYMMI|nr:hypothetical protein AK812_SmicGene10846 [Symbiodinium microadriaticum]
MKAASRQIDQTSSLELSFDRVGAVAWQGSSLLYREVRIRLLHALMQSDFNGRQYDAVFCEKALAMIADQRRLCYQMRVLCRTVQAAAGGNVGRNSAQLSMLCVSSSPCSIRGGCGVKQIRR